MILVPKCTLARRASEGMRLPGRSSTQFRCESDSIPVPRLRVGLMCNGKAGSHVLTGRVIKLPLMDSIGRRHAS
jgi:hypothetical protein